MNLNEWIEHGKPINKVVCCDCLEGMKHIPDNSVDLVLTDPPYNISTENDNRDKSKLNSPITRRKSPLKYDFGDWDNRTRNDFIEFTKCWLEECCRVLKTDGTIVSFFNKEDISLLGWTAKDYGIRTRTIFTWCKTNPVPSFRKVNYLSGVEFIWIGSKGLWTFNFGYQKDMKNYCLTPNSSVYGKTEHPTEKPLLLIEKFIKIHSNKDDVILDCFMGSGTTAIACKQLKRNFIGFEISEQYCKIARNRLKQENLNQWNNLKEDD